MDSMGSHNHVVGVRMIHIFEANRYNTEMPPVLRDRTQAVASSPGARQQLVQWVYTIPVISVLTSCFSVLPDFLSVHFSLYPESNGARILLWTSWTWIILRNGHFRVNKLDSGQQERGHIAKQRQVMYRVIWKFVLGVFAVGFVLLDRVIGVDDIELRTSLPPSSAIAYPLYSFWKQALLIHKQIRWQLQWSALGLLLMNHVFWEIFEHHVLATKRTKTSSISQYIRLVEFKTVRWVLAFYYAVICVLVGCCDSLLAGFVMILSHLLLIEVKTESDVHNGDELSTSTHCMGMVLALMVAISITTSHTDVFWITKFASVFPYFFMFISSTASHKAIKMRSEIKMFKHLCDTMVTVLLIRPM